MSQTQELEYDASTEQVYKIWLVNILLSILTLGIYRFWGKTRLRRYLTSGFILDGDRFDYTGTGGELFWGFMKALFFIIILFIPFFWSAFEISKMQEESKQKTEARQNVESSTGQQQGTQNLKPTLPGQTKPADTKKPQDSGPEAAKPETNKPQPPTPTHNEPEDKKPDADTGPTDESNINVTVLAEVNNAEQSNTNLKKESQTKPSDKKKDITAPKDNQPKEDIISLLMQELAKLTSYQMSVYGLYFGYIIFMIMVLPFMAMFQAYKYRASRLRYRGIRGHLIGSSLKYGIVGFIHVILAIFTLGLWKPFADLMLYKYKTRRLYFGSQQAQFKAPYITAFIYYFFWYFLLVVGIVSLSAEELIKLMETEQFSASVNSLGVEVPAAAQFQAYKPIFLQLGAVLVPIGAIGLTLGYRAFFDRVRYNKLAFGDIGFHCTITGWRLFKFHFANALILILTFGFGYPWVLQRRQRFLSRNLIVLGDLQNSKILQASGKEDTSGEGLFSFFDLRIRMF